VPSVVRLLALATVAVLAAAGCDTIGQLRLRNDSDTTFLSRVSARGSVNVEEIPAGVDDIAASVIPGFAPGRIELLRGDCSVVRSWPFPQGGGVLVVAPDGSGMFYPADANDAEPSPPEFSPTASAREGRLVRSVLRCGATETVPPG
jgi:hypothetical protein